MSMADMLHYICVYSFVQLHSFSVRFFTHFFSYVHSSFCSSYSLCRFIFAIFSLLSRSFSLCVLLAYAILLSRLIRFRLCEENRFFMASVYFFIEKFNEIIMSDWCWCCCYKSACLCVCVHVVFFTLSLFSHVRAGIEILFYS